MRSTIDSISRAKDASSKISILKTHAFNTGTFNVLSQLPKTIRQNITRDGDMLINAPEWCEEIWKTMRKNDFASQGTLNLPIVANIFNSHHKKIEKMLNIQSVEQLFDIMDTDEDGTVNEDEQILIFSIIKEKMLKVAEDLANIQEYLRYRDLMKAVRKMELQIAKYQDFLRKRIYKSELELYQQIGEASFEEFYAYYEEEFKKLNTYGLERETQLRAQHEDQISNLIDRLDRAVVALKFKPKSNLKEYQTQEKLVSIDERVEEAMNFRKELKDMEVNEAQRINKLRYEDIERQKNVLLAEQRKEMEHLHSKLKNQENKLIIRMKRDFDVLTKKTHLHENEIKKIQGLAAKYAMQKALDDGELKRTKTKLKKMKEILTLTKGTPTGGLTRTPTAGQTYFSSGDRTVKRNSQFMNSITLNSTDLHNRPSTDFIKSVAKSPNVIRFHLQKSYGEELPINVRPTNYANEDKLSHKKVEIYLSKAMEKNDEIPKLTSLYDENLRPVPKSDEDKVEKITSDEKKKNENVY